MIYMMIGGEKTWRIMPATHKGIVIVGDCMIALVLVAILGEFVG